MSAEKVIKITIDSSAAKRGAQEVNSALNSIGGNQSLRRSGAAAQGASEQFTRTGSAARRMGQDMSQAAANSNQSSGALGRVGAAASATHGKLLGLVAGLTAVTTAFLTTASAATGFADKMAEVSTLVDTATFDLSGLTDAILAQSVAFGKNPVETAGASYQIISAGASDATTATEQLYVAQMLAAGGVTTVETAADGLTSAVNAYGSGTLTSTAAADAMFVAMKYGKTTIDELSSSLGAVNPLAAQMGVSFDEVNAAVAALTKGGMSTSVATNGLRAILAAVAKPTEEAKKQAAALGIEFDAAAIQAMGLGKWIAHVKEKTGGSVPVMAQLFGGVEALTPALALTGSAGKDFNSTLDAMKSKGGATQEAFDKIAASAGFQLARVWFAMKVAAIDLGSTLLSVLTPAAKFIADNFLTAFQAGKILLGGFLAFKAASIATNFLTAGTALTRLGAIADGMNKVVAISTSLWRALNVTMLANPFIAVAALIGTTIALLVKFSDRISAGTSGMATLADVGAVVWDRISGGLAALGETFRAVWGGITGFVSGAFDTMRSLFEPFAAAIEPIVSAIGGVFENVFGGITFGFAGLVKLMARGVDLMISSFMFLGKSIGFAFANAPRIVGAALRGIANSVIGGIEFMVNKAIDGLNVLIGMVQKIPKIGDGISKIDRVKISRFEGESLGDVMSEAPSFEKGNWVESYYDGLFAEADARAAQRQKKTGAGTAASTITDVVPPVAANDNGAGQKGANAAGKAAEEAANKYAELIGRVQEEVALAKLTTAERDLQTKLLEAQEALKRKLTAAETATIQNLVEQKRLYTATTAMRETAQQLENKALINAGRNLELSDSDLAIQDEILKRKIEHLNAGGKLADIATETWQTEQARLETALKTDAAYEAQAQKLRDMQKTGADLIAQYGRSANPLGSLRAERDSRDAAIRAAVRPDDVSAEEWQRRVEIALAGSAEEFENEMGDVARSFRDNMVDSVYQIGDALGGTLGDIINGFGRAIDNIFRAMDGDYSRMGALGGIAKLFGSNADGTRNLFGNAVKEGFDGWTDGMKIVFSDPIKSMSGSFKSLKDAFVGPNGGFVKGLGNALGGAMAGAQMGSAIAGVGKMIWGKFSSTGSQLGGAVGSIFGPVGSILGSIGGGIIGGLFKKKRPDHGTANVSGGVTTSAGRGNGYEAAAVGAAGSVQEGLFKLTEALGGTLGNYDLSIGTYKGQWRVRDSAWHDDGVGLNFKGKSAVGLHDFGDDQAAAIRYAMVNAIKDGAVTGISSFAMKALNAATEDNLESMIDLATQYEGVRKELEAIADPVRAGADAINASFDTLSDKMKAVGASAEELGKVEELRAHKMQAFIDDQLKGLNDFKEALTGKAGGFTSLAVLTRDLAQFETMQADIAAGRNIDQDAYLSLGQDILSNAADVYGTSTSEFVRVRDMLMSATDGLIQNVNDATVVAIQEQTNAVTGQIGITNDLLRQIQEGLQGGIVPQGFIGGGENAAVNGANTRVF